MAIPRASSGMLRSQIRPAARNPAPLLRLSAGASRGTAKTHGKDDLGGPGGQEPRPSKPQGPDALKRNWPAIGGGILLAVGAFAYFSGSGPSKKEEEKIKEKAKAEAERLKSKTLSEADRLKEKGMEGWTKIEGKDGGAVGELSGRKDGKGGFRAE